MGATTKYALPYPELDDVDDVPTDMRELAERTEVVLTPLGVGRLGGASIVSDPASVPPGSWGGILTVALAAAWPGDDRWVLLAGAFDLTAVAANINGTFGISTAAGGPVVTLYHQGPSGITRSNPVAEVMRLKQANFPIVVGVSVVGGNFNRGAWRLTAIDLGHAT